MLYVHIYTSVDQYRTGHLYFVVAYSIRQILVLMRLIVCNFPFISSIVTLSICIVFPELLSPCVVGNYRWWLETSWRWCDVTVLDDYSIPAFMRYEALWTWGEQPPIIEGASFFFKFIHSVDLIFCWTISSFVSQRTFHIKIETLFFESGIYIYILSCVGY